MGKGNRNSQKRVANKAENAEKLLAAQKAKSKKTARDRAVAIAVAVIALVIVVALAFSVLSETGLFLRTQSAISGDTVKVDAAMMSFFLNDHIMNWYNQYGQYVSMFSIDLSKDLKDQLYGDTSKGYAYETYFIGSYDGTWYDYFLDTVKSQVEMYVVYAEAAKLVKEKDLSLSDEDKKEINEIIDGINQSLLMSGAELGDWYGKGVKESDVRKCYELIYLASNFAEYYQEKLENEITEDEIVDYREDNKQDFYTADCLTYTIKESSKGMTDEEYDSAVKEAKAAADKIATAKNPAEFLEFVEEYEASLKEKEETTDTDTDTDTETDVETEVDSNTDTDTNTDTETEENISDKLDKYKDTIEYETGTDNALNDFLFGNEDETGSDRIEAAEEGDATVIEETGTETEKETTSKKEEDKKEDDKKSAESESESESETETDKKDNVKTYETYKVTVYFVLDPMHFDTELTHDFAYLVSDEKQQILDFIEAFKASEGDKTLDLFVEVAEDRYEAIHNDPDHEHSSDEMFEFNKLEKTPANAFGIDYRVLNEWVEDAARKDKDISDAIDIKIVTTNSTTNKTETKTQYGVLFFDKHNDETWHVAASAGAVSQKFEDWYEKQLKDNPLEYGNIINNLDTLRIYPSTGY